MISVDEALAKVLALAYPPVAETVAVQDGLGRALLGPVCARITQPPFNAAAMDGYALRKTDLDLPLTVIGEAAAGRPWDGKAEPQTAVRIFTGAPVPNGYDHVVMQEDVTRNGSGIQITTPQHQSNIRPQGSDFAEGSEFDPRRRLTARDLGLIASMNVAQITVARRPVVAIIAGGDELIAPGGVPKPGQIISSNDITIGAIARRFGAEVTILPLAEDSLESLTDRFKQASKADLIVTIGGASVGDHDLVGKVSEQLGMERAFYKVAMRPGKPLIAGRIGDSAMIGLPGNPASAATCAEIFMAPLLLTMQGLPTPDRKRRAFLGIDLPSEGPRQHYQRSTLSKSNGRDMISPFTTQDSAQMMKLATADALLVRPADDPARKIGELVEYILLD